MSTRTGTVPGGLLVLGNEEFLRARATRQFLDALTRAHGELTRNETTAENLTSHEVNELLGPNLFGGFPVLTITEGNKLAKDTLAAVATFVPDPDCAVIIDIPKPTEAGGKAVVTALQKAGIHTETVTPPKNAKDRRAFVKAELRRVGLTCDYDAETALMDGEPDLRGIATRAEQLATDWGGGTITIDQVHHVTTAATITGFGVADALVARNPKGIATALRTALEAGAAPLFIQAACLATLRDLSALSAGNTGKMPPWKAQKLRPATRHWDARRLATALDEMGVIGETVRSSVRTENDLLAALLRAIT